MKKFKVDLTPKAKKEALEMYKFMDDATKQMLAELMSELGRPHPKVVFAKLEKEIQNSSKGSV